MLNTYIYHQLTPTCFSVCFTIFRETICNPCSRIICSLQNCYI